MSNVMAEFWYRVICRPYISSEFLLAGSLCFALLRPQLLIREPFYIASLATLLFLPVDISSACMNDLHDLRGSLPALAIAQLISVRGVIVGQWL